MLRLGQAYDTVEGELKNLEEDISSLQHQYHQLRGDSSSSVDLDTVSDSFIQYVTFAIAVVR